MTSPSSEAESANESANGREKEARKATHDPRARRRHGEKAREEALDGLQQHREWHKANTEKVDKLVELAAELKQHGERGEATFRETQALAVTALDDAVAQQESSGSGYYTHLRAHEPDS